MKKNTIIIIFSILIIIHVVLGWRAIQAFSPTYDEHVHLTAGYSYFATKDYRLNSFDHPPFAEMFAAVPLLFLNPGFPIQHPYWENIWKYQYPFSDIFIYKNSVDAAKMLHAGRSMILVLSVLLGLVIFLWSKELFGTASALYALFLWSFSPIFLAHGTLITTDMALALFYTAVMYMFWRWTRNDNLKNTLLFSLSLALLLASKYSSVVIFAVIGLITLYYYLIGAVKTSRFIKLFAVSGIIIFVILELIYQFNPLNIYYWVGLNKVFSGVQTGRSSFLMGEHSITGWLYYFPLAFLLKTPIPFIILCFSCFFYRKIFTKEVLLFVLWPLLFYFALSCYSKVNIGHRHILPIYPLLTVLVSGLYPLLKSNKVKTGFYILLAWYAFGTVKNAPWHLAYFNEFIGSKDKGYNYFTDSNIDWGQGLKDLGAYLKKENVEGIYFSYFGTGDPHYYNIKYRPIGFIDNISPPNSDNLRKGDVLDFNAMPKILFAISVTNLKATYYSDKNIFTFLNDIPYEKLLAQSILVYDLKKYPQALERLKQIINE
jgi:hypothetical protein